MFYVYADGELLYYPLDVARSITSPKLTLEVGKAGSFQFGIPPTNQYYGTLRKLKTIITVELDSVEIFRGRILSETKDFNNIKNIYCEGDLSYLIDSVQKGEAFNGTTHELFRKIVNAHNSRVDSAKRFTIGDIEIEDRSIILTGTSDDVTYETAGEDDTEHIPDYNYEQIAVNSIVNEWKTSYDYISECLIENCGGYLRTRREDGTVYLDYILDHGGSSTQVIKFGVNILDLTEEVSAEDLFTVLIPLGDDNLTIESVNGGSDELVDSEAVVMYGRIIKTYVFDNVNEPSTLLENGRRYLASKVNIPITITVEAVDLHLVNPDIREIHVGDEVTVDSPPHGVTRSLICTKIEYDLDNPGNNSYTFGNPTKSLTERYRKDRAKNTSGGSNGSGSSYTGISGAAAGAAATAAADRADQKTMVELQKFYDAWIDYDEGAATVSLGALSRIFTDAKNLLLTQVGIDLDGVSGNVNINSLRQWQTDADETLRTHENTLNLYHEEMANGFALASTRTYDLEQLEYQHYAGISGRVSDLESEMTLKATHAALDEVTGLVGQNTASIRLLANETSSQIELLTSTINDNDASIRLTATELGSLIQLNADHFNLMATKAELNGTNTEIDELKNHLTTKVGIDWDADCGTVNIYSISNKVDQHGIDILTNRADIQAHSDTYQAFVEAQAESWDEAGHRTAALEERVDANEATASLHVERLDGLDTIISETRRILQQEAGIYMTADPYGGSNINMQSFYQEYNRTKEEVDGVKQTVSDNVISIADVRNHADENGAEITVIVERTNNLTEETASINLEIDDLRSQITLKADTVALEAEITQIDSRITHIMGEQFVIDAIETQCKDLIAESIRVNGTISAFMGNIDVSVRAPNIHASNIMTLRGKNVATEEFAEAKALDYSANVRTWVTDNYATRDWVQDQSYLTEVPKNLALDGLTVNDKAVALYDTSPRFLNLTVTGTASVNTNLYVSKQLMTDSLYMHSGGSIKDIGDDGQIVWRPLATTKWVLDRRYLTEVPSNLALVGLTVNGHAVALYDTSPRFLNLTVTGVASVGGSSVATQDWVNDNAHTEISPYKVSAQYVDVSGQISGYNIIAQNGIWSKEGGSTNQQVATRNWVQDQGYKVLNESSYLKVYQVYATNYMYLAGKSVATQDWIWTCLGMGQVGSKYRLSNIEGLEADWVNANTMSTSTITANSMITMGGDLVATRNWVNSQGFLTEVPNVLDLDGLTVWDKAVALYDTSPRFQGVSVYENGISSPGYKGVATKEWVLQHFVQK